MSFADTHSLRQLIEQFPTVHLLCIGDVMLDRFIYGKVNRISPEAPVPVFHIRRETQSLGGAGNVVRNLADLGAYVTCASVIGNDHAGNEIMTLLDDLVTVNYHLAKEDHRVTTIKTRYVAGAQQMMRSDHEHVHAVQQSTLDQLKEFIITTMKDVQIILLSDYGKGLLQPHFVRWLIEYAHEHGKKIIVDPKGHDYTLYRGCDLITPNIKELAQASQLPVTTENNIVMAAQHIRTSYGISNVLVTRSERGMSLIMAEDDVVHIPTQAQEVYDVSGAGDTVLSVLASCLALKSELTVAAYLANIAAGLVVAKVGTASLTPQELLNAIETIPHSYSEDKVVALNKGVQKVIEWHRKGLRVGFTNGCFDLLHPGHISLIQQAKSHCDRLIIGINSDESVQRLKGLSRPVQSQQARSTMLAALADVDLIIIFNEDTPHALIKTLKPDILVKGADYTIDKVVGATEVISWGGHVILADLQQGYSTTNTINKMMSLASSKQV